MTGTTPLHMCAREGVVFTDIIKSLRINTNVKDSNGRLPLHMAAIGGHGDACRALISLGADINAIDSDGATALHLAAESKKALLLLIVCARVENAKLICPIAMVSWLCIVLPKQALWET